MRALTLSIKLDNDKGAYKNIVCNHGVCYGVDAQLATCVM